VVVLAAGSVFTTLEGAGNLLAAGAVLLVVLAGNALGLIFDSVSTSGTSTAAFSLFSSTILEATRFMGTRLPLAVSDSPDLARLRVVGARSSSSGSALTAAFARVERLVGDSGSAMTSIGSCSSSVPVTGVTTRGAEAAAFRRAGRADVAALVVRVARVAGLGSPGMTGVVVPAARALALVDEAVRVTGLLSSTLLTAEAVRVTRFAGAFIFEAAGAGSSLVELAARGKTTDTLVVAAALRVVGFGAVASGSSTGV